MRIITFAKNNRNVPIIAAAIYVLKKLRKLSSAEYLQTFSYWLHEHICFMIYKKQSGPLTAEQQQHFHNNHVLVLKDAISKRQLHELVASATKSFERQDNIISRDDLLPADPSLWTRLYDKYLNNTHFFYAFPADHLERLSYINNPLSRVAGLLGVIKNHLQPAISQLMGSAVQITRVWTYKTHNFGKQETLNHNGKFHLDGDRDTYIKCIVYLNTVSKENGPFCYRDEVTGREVFVTGKAGTVIFFRSSKLWHKGTNTLSGERLCFAFLATPSIKDCIAEYELSPNFIRKTFAFLPMGKKAKLQNSVC